MRTNTVSVCGQRRSIWLAFGYRLPRYHDTRSTLSRSLIIQLRHLRYFVKIVDAGSFSRAAATIYVAQPALSAQIAELEEELGVALLTRSARGVKPTAAGEALYREAMQVLRHIERIPETVRYTGGDLSGAVSIGMSSSIAWSMGSELMAEMRSALPRVRPSFVTGDSASLQAQIAGGTLDLALVFGAQGAPGLGHKVLFLQRLFVVDRKAPGSRRTISLQRAAELDLVLPDRANATRTRLDALFAAEGLVPNIVAEANQLQPLIAAVLSGLGATLLPIGDFSALGRGTLAAVAVDPPIEHTARLIWSASSALGAVGEAVRSTIITFVRSFIESAQPPGMVAVED